MKVKLIFLIVFCLVIVSSIAYLLYDGYRHPFIYSEPQTETVYKACGHGNSMEPVMVEGKCYKLIKVEKVEVNDIVDVKIYKPLSGQSNPTWHEVGKRLIKIREDGSWWLEGDNKAHSYDSRNYGWVLPSEMKLIGVVKVN